MTVGSSRRRGIKSDNLDIKDLQLDINWENVTCPICLDFPHNRVLLQCSSYENGCRPFMCDTDHTHSNCLERFKSAYGMPAVVKQPLATDGSFRETSQVIPLSLNSRPTCPLCRGHVTGWVVVDEARVNLNLKKRLCEEKQCSYFGTFVELQLHAKLKHPHSHPSAIDPAQRLDWENFQQSSDIVDVLSTIHAEVPHAVVLGDYVIEYGDYVTADELEDFPQNQRSWWNSCILYHMFVNFRASRNRRRSQGRGGRRGRRQSSSDGSNLGEGSPASGETAEYQFDEINDNFVRADGDIAATRGFHHRFRRHRALYDDR